MQQISQFVATTTGVNNTPTLIKRELSTLVTAKDDEIILIGGLDEQRTTNNESGLSFLPSFLRYSTHDGQNTEIVLMLTARSNAPPVALMRERLEIIR